MSEIKGFQPQNPDNPEDWEVDLGVGLSDRATQTEEMVEQLDGFHQYPYPEVKFGLFESRKKYREKKLKVAKTVFMDLLKLGGVSLEELSLTVELVENADRDGMRKIIRQTVENLETTISKIQTSLKEPHYLEHPKKLYSLISLRGAVHLLDSRYIWK